MELLKKTISIIIGIFSPAKSDNRFRNLSDKTDKLQQQTEDYLKEATMNGEKFWFLEQQRKKKNHMNIGGI